MQVWISAVICVILQFFKRLSGDPIVLSPGGLRILLVKNNIQKGLTESHYRHPPEHVFIIVLVFVGKSSNQIKVVWKSFLPFSSQQPKKI